MFKSVNLHTFRESFHSMDRQTQFSHEALEVLFDYLEELEDSTGEQIELDVIALCCDYSEDDAETIARQYDIDASDAADEDEVAVIVRDYLLNNTSLCGETSSGSFVYAQF